jgi:hypothetical protein
MTAFVDPQTGLVNESWWRFLLGLWQRGGGATSAINNTPIGSGGASTGAFTTLSASGTVSGNGFIAFAASPPAIGGTVANTGKFTSLTASSTTFTIMGATTANVGTLNVTGGVSGTGFNTLFASPPAIGSGTPAAGTFTALSATTSSLTSSTITNLTVSTSIGGTGLALFMSSPYAIGNTTPSTGAFTVLTVASNAGFALTSQTSSPGANTATLTNAPIAGNPAFWLAISINGTVRYVPCW